MSTWKKSAARIAEAWACRNCRQVGPDRRGAGSMPAARRISHTVDGATVMPSLVSSPWMRRYPQQRILLRQANDKAGDARGRRRAAGLAPIARVVLARGQPAVPGQQRRWRDGEDFGPAPAGYEPCQRGEPHPVSWLVSDPAGVAAQHRVLVPEHQQLSILRLVPAEHQDSEAEYPANQQVDDLEQHPASQPSPRPGCWRRHRSATQSIIRAAQGEADIRGITSRLKRCPPRSGQQPG